MQSKCHTPARVFAAAALPLLLLLSVAARAHGVAEDDRGFIERAAGMQLISYMYLGAKHMVTGYHHLLFLLGVIFFSTGCARSPPT